MRGRRNFVDEASSREHKGKIGADSNKDFCEILMPAVSLPRSAKSCLFAKGKGRSSKDENPVELQDGRKELFLSHAKRIGNRNFLH
jgi:hypothetical protein